MTNSQAEEAVSSTTEDEHPMMYPAEGYDNSEGADYNKSGGIRKWTLPCVSDTYHTGFQVLQNIHGYFNLKCALKNLLSS